MKLEWLPNEILIDCFEYLDGPNLFYAFDQLNARFSKLIRTILLSIDCQHVRKIVFDKFCSKLLLNPELKPQIYSLHLSNINTCISINRFLSIFSLNEFSNLRSLTLTAIKNYNVEKFKLILPLLSKLTYLGLIDSEDEEEKLLPVVPISQLHRLYADRITSILTSTDDKLTIKNITVVYSSFNDFWQLFRRDSVLRYLSIQNIYRNYNSTHNNDLTVCLTNLTIGKLTGNFDDLINLLKSTPNLKSLVIPDDTDGDMIDASSWENLITSSLTHLTSFKFKSSSYHTRDIVQKFRQFQTPFWHEQHHWYTEYTLVEDSVCLYTIPYISNEYILKRHTKRYPTPYANTFENVSNLILYQQAIISESSYYFPNVQSLTLENLVFSFEDVDDHIIDSKHIHVLNNMVNLSNIKHLTISLFCEIKSSTVFLQLLKQCSQLTSITIELYRLRSFLYDNEFCQYFNQKILQFDIRGYPYDISNSSDGLEQFCKIFSNLEQLICQINQHDHLLYLLIHLPKLSIVTVHLPRSVDYSDFRQSLEEEVRQQNFVIDIEYEKNSNTTLFIWINRISIKNLTINN